jgi:UDP-glucose 4-epimerase
VREIISAIETVSDRQLPTRESIRRPGDPPYLVADPSQIKRLLQCVPQYERIDLIVASAGTPAGPRM